MPRATPFAPAAETLSVRSRTSTEEPDRSGPGPEVRRGTSVAPDVTQPDVTQIDAGASGR